MRITVYELVGGFGGWFGGAPWFGLLVSPGGSPRGTVINGGLLPGHDRWDPWLHEDLQGFTKIYIYLHRFTSTKIY